MSKEAKQLLKEARNDIDQKLLGDAIKKCLVSVMIRKQMCFTAQINSPYIYPSIFHEM